MIDVLCIGKYNGIGRFISNQWKIFLEWCKTECNKVVIYSRMSYDTICFKFPSGCNINVLDKPDEVLDVWAYEINVNDDLFWSYLQSYNYSIDIMDDISHIYFFNSEKYIASLEVVDYENYIFIEEYPNQECKLLLNTNMVWENIQLCYEGKTDIEEFLQGEDWKPLGKC